MLTSVRQNRLRDEPVRNRIFGKRPLRGKRHHVIIVIGGIGSIKGAFVAAMVVGQIDIVGRAFLPNFLKTFMSSAAASSAAPAISQVLVYVLMALVLLY